MRITPPIDYSSNVAFMNALKNNALSVNRFLEHGQIDPNFINKQGASPLFYAIINKKLYKNNSKEGFVSQAEKLISMGADINFYYNASLCKEEGQSNLLILAARYRHNIFQKILQTSNLDINFKQSNGFSAAQACMRSGFNDGLKLLINAGAKIDNLTFNEVHKSHQWPTLEVLVKNDVPYHENEKGQNFLHIIAQQNKFFQVYESCIAHLAKKGFINQLDKAQNTPLYYALQNNNHKIINQFILNGADLSAVCQGVVLYDYVDKLLLELEGSMEKYLYTYSIPIIEAGKIKNDLEKAISLVHKPPSEPGLKFKL